MVQGTLEGSVLCVCFQGQERGTSRPFVPGDPASAVWPTAVQLCGRGASGPVFVFPELNT